VASALHLIAGGARSAGLAVAHRPTLEEAVGPTQYGEAIEDGSFFGATQGCTGDSRVNCMLGTTEKTTALKGRCAWRL
jgi:hypothetical protein